MKSWRAWMAPRAQAMDKFLTVLDREVKKFVPKNLRRKSIWPMWMNKNILRMMRKKRRL